jgi:hypothetical protein
MRAILSAIVLLIVAAPAAEGQVSFQPITSAGPISSINLGNDLSCQMTARGDPQPSFEPAGSTLGDCGTYALVVNAASGERTLFGPSDRVFLPTPDQPYTPDTGFAPNGQARVDSSGSSTVETRVLLGSTGLNLFQIDSYDGSTDGYTTGLQVQNTSPSEAYQVTVFRVFLCFLQGGTSGDFGTHTQFQGLEQPGCATGPGVAPARNESLSAFVGGANWVVAQYGDADGLLRAGAFPGTCLCGQDADLMVGLSFSERLDPTTTATTNIGWRTNSSGPQGAPAPQPEKTGTASTESGTVLVQAPGGQFVPLTGNQSIPVGSVVDTTNGVVRLTAAAGHTPEAGRGAVTTRTGSFGGGVFKFTQKRQKVGHKRLLTTRLALRGGNFAVCGTRSVEGTAARKRTVRYLKAKASGQFAVVGKNSSGLERGTTWTTTDRCDGTLTAVQAGKVAVTDFARHKTVTVRAGHSYLARP